MKRPDSIVAKYLPQEKDALQWGLHVIDAGHGDVAPHTPYPVGSHPDGYMFSWETGRRLSEYQMVYVTQGSGVFESRGTGRVQIRAGQVMLLFPGVWHRYRPTEAQGWTENWVGFSGDVADRIMRSFFSPARAVIDIGHDQEVLDVIRSISGLMSAGPPGYQQLIAARTTEALALVRSAAMKQGSFNRDAAGKVQQARQYLLQHRNKHINMEQLAADLGLSYSRFRALFKEHTGMAPHHYLISIRINMACYLLRDSNLPVAGVADAVGFSSQFYFARLFKKKRGCTPTEYRGRRKD